MIDHESSLDRSIDEWWFGSETRFESSQGFLGEWDEFDIVLSVWLDDRRVEFLGGCDQSDRFFQVAFDLEPVAVAEELAQCGGSYQILQLDEMVFAGSLYQCVQLELAGELPGSSKLVSDEFGLCFAWSQRDMGFQAADLNLELGQVLPEEFGLGGVEAGIPLLSEWWIDDGHWLVTEVLDFAFNGPEPCSDVLEVPVNGFDPIDDPSGPQRADGSDNGFLHGISSGPGQQEGMAWQFDTDRTKCLSVVVIDGGRRPMTDYELQTGDVLYDKEYDTAATIEKIGDTGLVTLDNDVVRTIWAFKRGIENGDIEHRPIRADGGEESAETATVEIEGTAEELDQLLMAFVNRQSKLNGYEMEYPDATSFLRSASLSVYEAMDELADTTEDV